MRNNDHFRTMINELRAYSTIERLRYDFRKVADGLINSGEDVKIIPNREIVIRRKFKLVFIVANDTNIRGFRPDSVVVDEMLPAKIKDHLFMSKKRAE